MWQVFQKEQVDWSNPNSKISTNFSVHEATYLPTWMIHHQPSEQEKDNILLMCDKMEAIRDYLGYSVNVHVWIRPNSVNCPGSKYHGKDYNRLVGGAPASAHIDGRACDWNPYSMDCNEARMHLLEKLDEFQIRMEDRDGSNWVHCDIAPVVSKRFFKP